MLLGLLWILGIYAASIALVHWYYRDQRRKLRAVTQVLLITHNNQAQIEWYIRSLYFFSRLKGRDIHVTLADEGSSDDTLAIAGRFRQELHLDICHFDSVNAFDAWIAEHEDEQVIVVRLSQQDGLVTAYRTI
ncbi:glycosyltransferase family A protein [Paenibacillus sp. TAB 01]|uniref:glycosyltransferase family A protein n=1 Tax=Paenibacillus sp. TAB 01 TaxID=3368988 RepID=UPI0037531E2E